MASLAKGSASIRIGMAFVVIHMRDCQDDFAALSATPRALALLSNSQAQQKFAEGRNICHLRAGSTCQRQFWSSTRAGRAQGRGAPPDSRAKQTGRDVSCETFPQAKRESAGVSAVSELVPGLSVWKGRAQGFASTSATNFGFRSMMDSKTIAARSGARRSCSQSRKVPTGRP